MRRVRRLFFADRTVPIIVEACATVGPRTQALTFASWRIRKVGDDIVLSPRPKDWSAYMAAGVRVSEDFMVDVDDLSMQERDSA